MRFALTLGHALSVGEAVQPALIDPAVARVLREALDTDILVLPAAEASGTVGVARLVGLDPDGGGGALAHLKLERWLTLGIDFDRFVKGPFPLRFLLDEQFDSILLAAEANLLPTPADIGADGGDEAQARFFGPDRIGTMAAVAAAVRREADGLCALTGAPVDAGVTPTPIRWGNGASVHVNNFLLLSPWAEAAFRGGHFCIRDDFGIIVDMRRIDPELLEQINANGRLLVSENPALQPAAASLQWHRLNVFDRA